MRKTFLFTLLLALMVLIGCSSAQNSSPLVGQSAPEIQASKWLNDNPTSLKDLKGKVVVVEFWATWCPPCRQSIPHLIELNQRFKKKDVVIVSLTNEKPDQVEPFAKEAKMDYLIGMESPTGAAYQVRGIPQAFIIDKEGKVVWAGHPLDGLDKALEKAAP